jgi:hypothetical protein
MAGSSPGWALGQFNSLMSCPRPEIPQIAMGI